MNLSTFVLGAILQLGGPTLPAADAAQYAADISAVAGDDVELAVALVATADEEGLHFSPRIARCECKSTECDRDARTGRATAYGLYQLHKFWFAGRTADEICASNRLSTQLAAKALVFLRKNHGRGSIRAAMRWYVGCPANDRRVTRRVAVFERLWANARRAA